MGLDIILEKLCNRPEVAFTGAANDDLLCNLERLHKIAKLALRRRTLGTHRCLPRYGKVSVESIQSLTKEGLGGCVQGETRVEILDLDWRVRRRQRRDDGQGAIRIPLKYFKIRNPISGKEWAGQIAMLYPTNKPATKLQVEQNVPPSIAASEVASEAVRE